MMSPLCLKEGIEPESDDPIKTRPRLEGRPASRCGHELGQSRRGGDCLYCLSAVIAWFLGLSTRE